MAETREGDLVLPPNTYAYVLEQTKGRVSAWIGPNKVVLSDADRLVTWNEAQGQFTITTDNAQARKTFVKANERQYVILSHPASGEIEPHPRPGDSQKDMIDLDTGRKIVIAGPTTFPLWPGQTAEVIDGHDIRHNQFLLVRVYEPGAANNSEEFEVPQNDPDAQGQGGDPPEPVEGRAEAPTAGQYTMGQLIIKKGTDVSYYIPSTGIEVLKDERGSFIREAVTLERMEYCILLDENGNKRYVRGPNVVFPEPTEAFVTNIDGDRKSKAIELNEQSGLHIKVIAPYTEEDGTERKVGEELFITGKEMPIYFPRQEHLIITYGDQRKHHAIAIPQGEGRYVLDRDSGRVPLEKGPDMFLPDPRHRVIVKRILPDSLVKVMYPGNEEALRVNQAYAEEKVQVEKVLAGQQMASPQNMMYSTPDVQTSAFASAASSTSPEEMMRSARSMPQSRSPHEQTARKTSYTPPRTLVLDNKYSGAVEMEPYSGYAILLVNKIGDRRVVIGPEPVLLEYDEIPMVLSLSTGTPKSDDRRLRTPYLRIDNQVSDELTVETQDLVPVTLTLSLRVKFETDEENPDPERWFATEDYIKVLTDNCRSRLRNRIKRYGIQEFYSGPIDIIRDTLLGESPEEGDRPGLPFAENGMRLYDVEVLDVNIEHAGVDHLLNQAMATALEGSINLANAEQKNVRDGRHEELRRLTIVSEEQTAATRAQAAVEQLRRNRATALQEVANQLDTANAESEVEATRRSQAQADIDLRHGELQARNAIDLARTEKEVEQFVQRTEALQDNLMLALQSFGDKVVTSAIMEALGPPAMALNMAPIDLINTALKGTPLESVTKALADRPYAQVGENGGSD